MTYGNGVPWGGFSLIPNGLTAGSPPWVITQYDTAVAAGAAAPIGTYVGRLSPLGIRRVAFSAGAAPAWSNSRFAYGGPASFSALAALYPQVLGRAGRAKATLRHGPFGVTTADVRLTLRGNGTSYAADTGYFATYATQESSVVHTATYDAAFDWAAHTTFQLEMEYRPGATTRAGEILYDIEPCIFESDIGVTHVNCSVGGRTAANFLNDDVFSDTLWTAYFSGTSGERVLWLSLGTNGEPHTVATLLAQLQQLIADFRALQPNGYVLIDSAYLGAVDRGYSVTRRTAIEQLVALDSRVLYLDTCAEMGPYTSQFARGLYGSPGDGVHYVADPGIREYVATISAMIHRAALL